MVTKECRHCGRLRLASDFREREVRGRTCLRTYCRECERELTHKAHLKSNREGVDNRRRWEPVMNDDRLAKALADSKAVREAGYELETRARAFQFGLGWKSPR
jgi:hypothetical protein